MAIVWMGGADLQISDNFSWWNADYSPTYKKIGTHGYTVGQGEGFVITLAPALSKFYINYWVYTSNSWTHCNHWSWRKGSTVLGGVKWNRSYGRYDVYTGNYATLVGTTRSHSIPYSSQFPEVQIMVKIAEENADPALTGRIQVWVDQILQVDFSGDTKPGADVDIDNLASLSGGAGMVWYMDCIVVDNAQPNPGCRVVPLVPAGSGSTTEWTPSAGNNWDCCNEVPMTGTDYVTSLVENYIDSYAFNNLAAEAYEVRAVSWIALARKNAAPAFDKLKPRFERGGVEGLAAAGTGLPIGNLAYERRLLLTSPITGAPWTVAEINEMEVGFKVVSA